MKFIPYLFSGAYLIELEHIRDRRGFFARMFCIDEFKKYGLQTKYSQISTSFNKKKDKLGECIIKLLLTKKQKLLVVVKVPFMMLFWI